MLKIVVKAFVRYLHVENVKLLNGFELGVSISDMKWNTTWDWHKNKWVSFWARQVSVENKSTQLTYLINSLGLGLRFSTWFQPVNPFKYEKSSVKNKEYLKYK